MADLPQSSFIPKRSATSRVRQPRRYNFFIIGIISYALFIAAPVAAAAVFVYETYTERQLAAAIQELDTAINDFSVSDMLTVVEFDNRLRGAQALLSSHVSLVHALTILEEGTAQSIVFENLDFKRTDRSTITLSSALTAENFDAAIFQRESYMTNELLASTLLEDLSFTPDTSEQTSDTPDIAVNGTFTFAANTILYTPQSSLPTDTPAAAASTEDDIVDNLDPDVEEESSTNQPPL
jgi:hypothetical protein